MEESAGLRTREIYSNDPVGIDSLPHQLVKKRMQDGFVFNILLIGETGIGKSTLVCSLFNVSNNVPTMSHNNLQVKLKSHTYDICEKNVKLKLTIVETIGYGDQINRNDSIKPITKYIESQFETYFKEESKLKRSLSTCRDTRIHACLYFICPTGHSLKAIDIFCMKELHDKVNLIPIVAKADSLSKEEIARFKLSLKSTIEKHGIKIYCFPTEDEATAECNSKSNGLVPLAVAASEDFVDVKGRPTRARIFPWGTMLVEDEENSDFLALRQALVEDNIEDMIEKTHDEYFENYRKIRMTELGYAELESENEDLTYQEIIEKHRKKLQLEMLEKDEQLRKKFIEKVKEKDEELMLQEAAMRVNYDHLFEQLKKEELHIQLIKNKLEREIWISREKWKCSTKKQLIK